MTGAQVEICVIALEIEGSRSENTEKSCRPMNSNEVAKSYLVERQEDSVNICAAPSSRDREILCIPRCRLSTYIQAVYAEVSLHDYTTGKKSVVNEITTNISAEDLKL